MTAITTEQPKQPHPGPEQKLHRVHSFVLVRVEQRDIPAPTHHEAIKHATEDLWPTLYDYFANTNPESLPGVVAVEFAEEITHYLVDEEGDQQYSNTRFYASDQQTTLSNLCPTCLRLETTREHRRGTRIPERDQQTKVGIKESL